MQQESGLLNGKPLICREEDGDCNGFNRSHIDSRYRGRE